MRKSRTALLNANRKYLKLKTSLLFSSTCNDKTSQCFAIISRKSKLKLAKVLKHLPLKQILKHQTNIIDITPEEAKNYIMLNRRRNEAVITGCRSLKDCSACEQFVNTIKPSKVHFSWYKHKTTVQWKFELTFEHETAKDSLNHKWMHYRDPALKHLLIYTKDANYHETQSMKLK